MPSIIAHQEPLFTLRLVLPDLIHPEAAATIVDAIRLANSRLENGIGDGLLISVLPGSDIVPAHSLDEQPGLGVYHSGIEEIWIAGRKVDEQPDQEFLDELTTTTVHECVHYWQDLNGRFDGCENWEMDGAEVEEVEAEAVRLTGMVLGSVSAAGEV